MSWEPDVRGLDPSTLDRVPRQETENLQFWGDVTSPVPQRSGDHCYETTPTTVLRSSSTAIVLDTSLYVFARSPLPVSTSNVRSLQSLRRPELSVKSHSLLFIYIFVSTKNNIYRPKYNLFFALIYSSHKKRASSQNGTVKITLLLHSKRHFIGMWPGHK